jgi:hypothetical protein
VIFQIIDDIVKFIDTNIENKMRSCEYCGKVKFYSLNFIFSKAICNDCYLSIKTFEENSKENNDDNNKIK